MNVLPGTSSGESGSGNGESLGPSGFKLPDPSFHFPRVFRLFRPYHSPRTVDLAMTGADLKEGTRCTHSRAIAFVVNVASFAGPCQLACKVHRIYSAQFVAH